MTAITGRTSFGMTMQERHPADQAMQIVSHLAVWKLRGARVFMSESPDLENPGGYYHRSVTLMHLTWGGIKRKKVLYFEASASDEYAQERVFKRVQKLITAVNKAH